VGDTPLGTGCPELRTWVGNLGLRASIEARRSNYYWNDIPILPNSLNVKRWTRAVVDAVLRLGSPFGGANYLHQTALKHFAIPGRLKIGNRLFGRD